MADEEATENYAVVMGSGMRYIFSLTSIGYVDLLRAMGKPTIYSQATVDLNGLDISSIEKTANA